MADNPYDPAAVAAAAAAAAPPSVPVYQTGNPFAPPADPNAIGGLGMTLGTGRSLMELGANMSAAANARIGGGFLANGTGFLGPLMAGVGQTLQQGQQDVNSRAAYNSVAAQTLGEQYKNRAAALDLQYQQARIPWLIQSLQNGSLTDNGNGLQTPGAPSGAAPSGTPGPQSSAPPTTGANVPPDLGAAFRTTEAGSADATKGVINKQGYAGVYQLGTAALKSAGLYTPGKDEDLTKNQWQGQITIPGYGAMGVTDFINNRQAQDAAFSIHMANLGQRAHDLGLDTYVGQNVGGVQITPETLAAMEQYGGPIGTLKFLQSGGAYNPTDANGKYTLASYANEIAKQLPTNYKSPQNWFVKTASTTEPPPRTVGSGDNTGSPTTGAGVGATVGSDVTGTGPQAAAANVPYQVAQSGNRVPAGGTATPGGQVPSPQQVNQDAAVMMRGMGQGQGQGQGQDQGQGQGQGQGQAQGQGQGQDQGQGQGQGQGQSTEVAQAGTGPYAVHSGQTQPPVAPPGYVTPQQAMGRAQYLRGLAQRQALAGMSEMATGTNQQAQQLEQYAQTQLINQSTQAQEQTRQQTAPIEGRGPGSFATYMGPDGKMHVLQSPIERDVLGPDRRHYLVTLNSVDTGEPYVRPAGVPSWAPPGTLTVSLKDLSDTEKEAMKVAANEAFGPESAKEYQGAANSKRTLEDMELQFDRLNSQPGGFNTGPGLQFKTTLARGINTIARTLGGTDIVDPTKVASVEDIIKNSKLLGMDVLTQRFGGNKEAASIVESAQTQVPNIENSPLGAKLLLNAYKEAAQYVMDQHAFETNWYFTHNGNMIGSDITFVQSHTPQSYADRAVSQAFPLQVDGKDPSELDRYLPDTKVFAPGVVDPKTGQPKIKTVPGNVGIKLEIPTTTVPGGINTQPPGQ